MLLHLCKSEPTFVVEIVVVTGLKEFQFKKIMSILINSQPIDVLDEILDQTIALNPAFLHPQLKFS